MKVLITAVQFSSELSGIQRHALMLTRALLHQAGITHIDLVVAPWQERMFQHAAADPSGRIRIYVANVTRGLLSRNAWYYRDLPRIVEQLHPDIVHLTYPVPVHARRIAAPIVLTLHDIYPYDIPENFGFPKALFNRAILKQCLRSVDAIACVSDTTSGRARQLVSTARTERILRIYNCVEPCLNWSDASPIHGWRGEPFLLTVSQHRKNKNIPLLISVFHDLLERGSLDKAAKLLIVGIHGPETPLIQSLIAERGLSGKVILLAGISEEELQWCYRHCDLLAAPSSIEGFGLPVAEAILAGCRVVCSDIPAFREIDAGRCTFFSLEDSPADNLREAIVATLSQPHATPTSLPQFLPEKVGTQYAELYARLSAQRAGMALPQETAAPAAMHPKTTPQRSVAKGWGR